MKNFDLRSKINAVQVPERDEVFWQALPGRVLARANAVPPAKYEALEQLRRPWTKGLARFAVACLVLGVCLWETGMPQRISRHVLKDEQELRQSFAQVPQDLETLMRDEHGLHYLVQDQP